MMHAADQRIVFVSGLSGSGKSTAMAALEDLAFYCVDNLPAPLTPQFLDLCAGSTPPITKVALAIDARESAFLNAIPAVVEDLRRSGAAVTVVFLECATEVLVNRYRETRRVHPLAHDGSVTTGIETERELLTDVSRLADVTIDTSQLNVHELRETIVGAVAGHTRQTIVNLTSFGFRYGVPTAAELLFDVRFLPNPHFEAGLRPGTGMDEPVAAFVLKDERTSTLLNHLHQLLEFLLPCYDDEGKAYLTVGVGCTGGRHRSVAIVETLRGWLDELGREVNVTHRDVSKST